MKEQDTNCKDKTSSTKIMTYKTRNIRVERKNDAWQSLIANYANRIRLLVRIKHIIKLNSANY